LYILKPFLKIQQNLAPVMRKKLILIFLFIIFYTITHAQYERWMVGTWKSASGAATVTNTIQIDDVSGESFTGTRTSEINGSHAKITVSISGAFKATGLYLQDGALVHKEGPDNGQSHDCSACTEVNKMFISHDSLILSSSISDCNNGCDAEARYYRLLSEYDDPTQRYLVDRFGRPSDIIGFHPYHPQEDKPVASSDDDKPLKNDVVASTTVTDGKRLQHINDSTAAAIKKEEKRHREIQDSLNTAREKEQRVKDSLDNIAKIRQQQINDSILLAQQKKRQQQIADSLNLVQQKEQQRIKDSLDNVARARQQQINDSAQLAQQKKRQQQIADSLNLVQQKEQKRINDSVSNVARLEQIRLRAEDSLRNVQVKKRQQEVADSLSVVNQKRQQYIKDSLQNVAAANLQKQRTADSLREVQATKRQQEISDSLAAIRKQQYNDSLQKAALAKAVPPATTDIAPSDADKALTSRTSVLLGTYHITSPDILIELFDNGEIDSDRVSVYHNNESIVNNQVLGTKPITLNIHADATNREHDFVMIAENLGTIPPNSALMRITAGKQSYKLSVNTDMKTNARIVLYYDGN
jgi:hypothetical protein